MVSTLHLNHTVGGAAVSIELKYLLVCRSRVVFIRAYNEKQKKKNAFTSFWSLLNTTKVSVGYFRSQSIS